MLRRLPVLLLLTGCLPGQEEGASTYLHQALLSRAPLIVRARFVRDQLLRRVQVTTFQVVETLRGPPLDRVLVGAMGERARAFPKLEKILFLKPMTSGRLCELVDLVDLTSRDTAIVPRFVRRYLELEKEPNPIQRERAVLGMAFEGLESGSLFGRRLAVRELSRIVSQHPYLLTARDLTRLEGLRRKVPGPERWRYRRLLDRLNRHLASTFVGCEVPFEEGKERELFLRATGRFRAMEDDASRIRLLDELVRTFGRKLRLFCEALLADRSPAVRKRAAWFLGEFGEPASVPPLLRALERASGKERREPLTALGKIGDVRALGDLKALLAGGELVDDAILAVARIGGPEAGSVLERLESRLDGENERAGRIRFYRSREFIRREAARRLEARRAYDR